MIIDYSLYLIADSTRTPIQLLLPIVEEALTGGVTIVQYRDKISSDLDFKNSAKKVLAICRRAGIPMIVNDRIGIAMEIDADGVHLGQTDQHSAEVRSQLGSGKILGMSAHTPAEAHQAEEEAFNYLGCGSVFPTTTKHDIRGILGIDGLERIAKSVNIPVVAIGGINTTNVVKLRDTGIAGIAVVSAILQARNPGRTAGELKDLLKRRA